MKLLVTFTIIIIVIPIGITYFLYRFIKRKEYDKRLRFLAFIPVVIMGYIVYDSIYPSSDFYEKDFKEVTNMKFPENGIIKYKSASFPDNFGDYSSAFLIELDNENLLNLEQQLIKEGFEEKENKMYTNELEYIVSKKGNKNYTKQFIQKEKNGRDYSVSFLDDNKSVIISRVSW